MTAGELNTQQTRRDDGHAARFPYPLSGTALAMVVAAAVFWAFFTNIANYNLDSYRDMLQNHGWGIRWQWGNSSHPPLFGWITAAWFEVFPRTNLAYRFLASINLALSLCIILLLARRVIEPKRQVVLVAVAILLPLLGFQAQIYNANSAMLPFWALTAYLYVISIERPSALRLVALGFTAAFAMLAKYHSAVLLMALTAHAFWFQPARMVLLSPRLLWVIAGFAPFAAMHLHWLFANDFAPIVFAAAEQGETTISNIAFRQIEFFAAQIIYALPGLLALAVLWRPRDTVLSDARAAAAAFFVTATGSVALFVVVGSVVFTMLLGILVWSPLTANWSLPVFLFVTLVFVGCLTPNFEVSRLRPLIVAYGALMLFLLAIAPQIRSIMLDGGRLNAAVPLRDIVQAAEVVWERHTVDPLLLVTGQDPLPFAASFYAVDRPQTKGGRHGLDAPWIDGQMVTKTGYLVMCFDADCATASAPDGWVAHSLGNIDVPPPIGASRDADYTVYLWHHRSAPK